MQPEDKISAIATDQKYGTSEPAFNALIKAVDSKEDTGTTWATGVGNASRNIFASSSPPKYVSAPPEPKPEPTPQPIRIKLPRIVHFALDKSYISPASATVLNRLVQVLQQYPFIVIDIQGHTDPRANDASVPLSTLMEDSPKPPASRLTLLTHTLAVHQIMTHKDAVSVKL